MMDQDIRSTQEALLNDGRFAAYEALLADNPANRRDLQYLRQVRPRLAFDPLDVQEGPREKAFMDWHMVHTRTSNTCFSNQIMTLYTLHKGRLQKVSGSLLGEADLFEILSVACQVKLLPGTRQVDIEACLLLRVIGTAANRIILRLNHGLSVREAECSGQPLQFELLDSCRNGIIVYFGHPLQTGREFTLTLRYGGIPVLRYPNYIMESRTLIWDEAMLLPSLNFFPKDKYRLSVVYHYEGKHTVVSCGTFLKEEVHANMHSVWFRSDEPVLGLSFALGPYHIMQTSAAGVNLTIYSACDQAVPVIAERVDSVLKFYNKHFSEVPYKALQICYDPDFTICCINSNLIYLYRTDDIAVSHELAHLWWGMCVTGNGPGWKWFHEAFAEFFSELFVQQVNEKAPQIHFHSASSDGFTPFESTNYFGMGDEDYERYKDYLKRLVVKLGWEEFLQRLQQIYEDFRFKSITVEHLIAELENGNET